METMNPAVEYRPCPRLPADRYLFGSDGTGWWRLHPGHRWKKMSVRLKLGGKPRRNRYPTVQVRLQGRARLLNLGPLILSAFGRPRPLGMECHYIDGNPANCRLGNLEWRERNHSQRGRAKPKCRGEAHPSCKLDEAKVREARRLYARSPMPVSDLAEHYGITRCVMADALTGRTWGHLDGAVAIRRRIAYGSGNAKAKLDEIDVAEIRGHLRRGVSLRALARQYGVCHTSIKRIRRGESWIHVTEEMLDVEQ